MFFDLQAPALASEFRADPEAVMSRYPLDPEVKQALKEHRIPFLAQRTNAYLLRYYFFAVGTLRAFRCVTMSSPELPGLTFRSMSEILPSGPM